MINQFENTDVTVINNAEILSFMDGNYNIYKTKKDGDLTFVATSVAEVFDGGNGVDTIDYSLSDVKVSVKLLAGAYNGYAESDRYSSVENVIGTNFHHDFIEGDAADNSFWGLDGNDQLRGHLGDDTLYAGAGNDYVAGQAGDDILHGNEGNDRIYGGDGFDISVYAGEYQNYTVSDVGTHISIIDNVGDEGVDTVGYDVERYLFADGVYENGVFTSNGELINAAPVANNDNFIGDEGQNIMGNVLSDNGAGADTDLNGNALSVVAIAELTTSQGGTVNLSPDGSFSYIPALNFVGSDSFIYTLQDGNGGHDTAMVTLTVNAANNNENNNFIATSAIEIFEGSDGVDDTVDYSNADERVVVKLFFGGEAGSYAAGDSYFSIENVIGSDGPHFDYLEGDNNNNVFYGLAGNDTLSGWGGDDILYGGEDNDYLHGGEGDDRAVYVGSYTNYTVTHDASTVFVKDDVGNEGQDRLVSIEQIIFADGVYQNGVFIPNDNDWTQNDQSDDLIEHFDYVATQEVEFFAGSEGIDTIDYSNSDAKVSVKLLSGGHAGYAAGDSYGAVENVIGTNFHHDFIEGNAEDNVLWGLDGNDQLYGNHDQLYGNLGNDILYAGAGNDSLIGHSGDDILYGGEGNDNLYGGAGADQFVFTSDHIGHGVDRIKDFSLSDGDIIDLSEVLELYDRDSDIITDFLRLTDNGADSILSVDVDGGMDNFVQVALIEGVTDLTDENSLQANGTLVV